MRLCSSKDEAIQYAAAEIIKARDTPPSAWRSVKKVGAVIAICALLYSSLLLLDIAQGRTENIGEAVLVWGAISLLAPFFGALDYIVDRSHHEDSKLCVFDWAEEYRK